MRRVLNEDNIKEFVCPVPACPCPCSPAGVVSVTALSPRSPPQAAAAACFAGVAQCGPLAEHQPGACPPASWGPAVWRVSSGCQPAASALGDARRLKTQGGADLGNSLQRALLSQLRAWRSLQQGNRVKEEGREKKPDPGVKKNHPRTTKATSRVVPWNVFVGFQVQLGQARRTQLVACPLRAGGQNGGQTSGDTSSGSSEHLKG